MLGRQESAKPLRVWRSGLAVGAAAAHRGRQPDAPNGGEGEGAPMAPTHWRCRASPAQRPGLRARLSRHQAHRRPRAVPSRKRRASWRRTGALKPTASTHSEGVGTQIEIEGGRAEKPGPERGRRRLRHRDA